MFNDEYERRCDFQQITSFLLHGEEAASCEEGTPEERRNRYTEYMLDSITKYAQTTWLEGKDPDFEKMRDQVFASNEKLIELAYEMGLRMGLKLGRTL